MERRTAFFVWLLLSTRINSATPYFLMTEMMETNLSMGFGPHGSCVSRYLVHQAFTRYIGWPHLYLTSV